MTASLVPISLRLTGRRVVVVGGGHVASRRTSSFLEAGAEVVVIAPELSAALAARVERREVAWVARPYQTGDLDGAWLVQTATADPVTDEAVARDAENARLWCLKGGDPEHASAWMPATGRVDDIVVSVNAGGDARRAATLRDALVTALESGELPLRHRTHHPGGKVALVGAGPGDPGLLTTR
ncbi:bifunctional precorrin-2 dehydrogenase/sirohydrochlorin ferrochelatase, partial [uncultured Aeromicrobium sp.]|uniref:precorrin-2 dehydrogenase/sirohydrochlorin ferrochelatase family protein n=1 Tax=uncultured Aeromicrobium sp. TaxID=337820 RepID=UPI0025FEAED1